MEKARQYRLLNEPRDAESICLDVLAAEAGHQDALATLILARTDQFGDGHATHKHACELLGQIESAYEKLYYEGLICERWAKANLDDEMPGFAVHDWLTRAMTLYEQAAEIAPANDAEATLRFNACARLIARRRDLAPRHEYDAEAIGRDDVPHG